MNSSVVPPGFESLLVVVIYSTNGEKDPKEDSEEAENTEGSEDFEDPMDSNELKYHRDSKDFNL